MTQEAKANEEVDKKKKESAEIKNQAETLIYTTEKTLTDLKDKVVEEDKKAISEKIEELKKVKDGADLEAIKGAIKNLNEVVMKIGERIYKDMGDNKQQPGTDGPQEGQYEKK